MTVTIDKFGRVLIPKPLRDQLGLEPGAELSLDINAGDGGPTLELRPEPAGDALSVQDGLLVYTGAVPSAYDAVQALRDEREARALRHAGLDPDAQ